MKRRLALTCLPFLLATTTAHAADWLPSTARYAGEPHEVASAHLTSLGLDGLEIEKAATLPVGQHTTVRFVQKHGGLPVIGGQAAVMIAPDGSIDVAVLDFARGLTVGTTPAVSEIDARAAAASRVGLVGPAARAELAIERDHAGGRLVWRVDVPTHDGGWRIVVDALDGKVIAEHGLARDALGRIYPISKVTTPDTEDVELVDLVESDPQYLNGWGGNLTVVNYLSGSIQGALEVGQSCTPNSGDPTPVDFLYDPPTNPLDGTDAFAQVGVYHHLTRMRSFFAGLGVDQSATSWKLTAVANMQTDGSPLDNAFFSPMGITGDFASPNLIGIGQGSQFDFADDSDVFLHEFTHYVSHNAVGYNGGQTYSNSFGLHPFGGSIDEGISDYFACSENDDSFLGEASLALLGSGRELTDTSKTCPDDIIGEVHADGEIIGSFGWTLREMFGKDIGDQLVWGATTLLTMDASLGDFARGVRETANTLVADGLLEAADLTAIDAAIAARGLDECDTELPLREGEPRTASLFGLDLLALVFGGSCDQLKGFGLSLQSLFHYVVTPASGDEGVRISVQMTPQGGSALDWGIYVRKNEHVTFASSGFLPEVSAFDYSIDGVTATSGEIVIDASSDPPFDPNATYHVVLVHQNCPSAIATIATSSDLGQGGEGGQGGTGAGVGGGSPADPGAPTVIEDGCGCRIVGGGSDLGGLTGLTGLAGLFGLALYRRRRSGSW
jgi:MYXO-CTERM domain-containing protein